MYAKSMLAGIVFAVVTGFVRDGRFLTRDEAMGELAECGREVLYAQAGDPASRGSGDRGFRLAPALHEAFPFPFGGDLGSRLGPREKPLVPALRERRMGTSETVGSFPGLAGNNVKVKSHTTNVNSFTEFARRTWNSEQ